MTTEARRDPRELIDLSGKVALVTGGTRNIGREMAELFAACGAAVAVVGRSDGEALKATVAALEAYGQPAFGTLADIGVVEEIHRAVDEVTDGLGPVDILVNNAAVRPHGALEDLTVEDWDAVMAINLRAPFLFAQRVLPGMKERKYGRIINVSGLSALWGKTNRAHVSASKAGVMGLTIALAAESALENVTVNCIVPGLIDTERHTPEWYPDLDDFYQRRVSRIPMGRLGRPEEIASVCLFLVSELSSYMTGQTLFVSGGSHPMVRGA
jgi:3-oxoacyl-[acyl-carrier protein] reductase